MKDEYFCTPRAELEDIITYYYCDCDYMTVSLPFPKLITEKKTLCLQHDDQRDLIYPNQII